MRDTDKRVNLDRIPLHERYAVEQTLLDAHFAFVLALAKAAERRAWWQRVRLYALYAALIVLSGAFCGLLMTLALDLVKP